MDRIKKLQKITFKNAFDVADDVLRQGVQSITELINDTALVNLDFADVSTVMKNAGYAHMGVGYAAGKDKAEEAAKMANSLYIDRSINEFLEKRYESGVDYFKASAGVMEKTFYEISSGTQNTNVIMYSDNETIVNGNHFHQISSVKEEEWYQTLQYSGGDILLIFYYIGEAAPTSTTPRKVSVIRKLDYYKDLPSEKLVKIDLDYGTIVRRLNDMKFNMPVYLCKGNQILF